MSAAHAVHFSQSRDDWETPQDLFNTLDREFHFNLDPCATSANRKVDSYIPPHFNGLDADWGGRVVFCNPPYSKLREWVAKAERESRKPDTVVVMLLPARTDTRAFHDHIFGRAQVRFVRGRLRFVGANASAPFPSCVVVFGESGCTTINKDGTPCQT